MTTVGRRRVTAYFERFLSDAPQYSYTPTLRHGNFDTGNIIFDPDAGRIIGSVVIGDPAIEIRGPL
jgi:aminoglycoside phosphotransferase (APT) family kinase protein